MSSQPRLNRFVLYAALGMLPLGCSQPVEESRPIVRPVKVHVIGSLEPAALREFPGTIRAFQTAEMGFEVAGRIEAFLVREGNFVNAGDEMARLDPTDYKASLAVAEANLQKAIADLVRSENIRKQDEGAISEAEIETNRRAKAIAEAHLVIARKAVNDTTLRAPFDGVMARKLVEDFANVQAKEPVLILQDNSILEIEVAIPERDFVQRRSRTESKEEATRRLVPTVIVSSLPDQEFPARIREYATIADSVTRTFPVKLNFENPEEFNILPGMTARVRVVIDPASAWSVPVGAAQVDAQGQPFVWKVDPTTMTVARTPVELGPLSGDRVLLSGGVTEGDVVAISGIASLRDGMSVRFFESSREGAKAR